jgi:hypothetical protein
MMSQQKCILRQVVKILQWLNVNSTKARLLSTWSFNLRYKKIEAVERWADFWNMCLYFVFGKFSIETVIRTVG